MNKLFADSRKGMAVPVVLLIVLCVMVMTITLFHFRKQSKQQNVSNFHFLRVNFLAQSAIQHMLLKLSVFPQEAYDAGVLSLGYCPFRGIIFGNNNTVPPKGNSQNKEKGLKIFFEDCNTDEKSGGIKWVIDKERMKYADNNYKVDLLEVMSAYNNITEKRTYLTSKIIGIGEAKMEKGDAGFRKERLEKVIQLTGNN